MIQSHLAENESMVQRQLELLVGVIYWLVVQIQTMALIQTAGKHVIFSIDSGISQKETNRESKRHPKSLNATPTRSVFFWKFGSLPFELNSSLLILNYL